MAMQPSEWSKADRCYVRKDLALAKEIHRYG
jgi:hypothetical protein